jgi:hypothetical protein
MLKNKESRNFFGWASIGISAVPWAVGASRFIPGLTHLDLTFSQVAVFLAVGGVLAFIAAARGSGKWAFVALFNLVAFFVLIFLLNLQELR